MSDNPFSRLVAYELRHLAGHLAEAGRADDLHHLLAIETPSGRNAWHDIKDRGEIASYLNDVQLAWQLAETDYRPADQPLAARSIALQCRYALMVTSVRNLAQHLPPILLLALLQHSIWTPEWALEEAQQVPDETQRADSLIQLAPYLSEEQLNIARAAARTFTNPRIKALFLVELSRYLPTTDRAAACAEALEAARMIPSDDQQAEVFGQLAVYSPMNVLSEMLAAARNIWSYSARATAVVGMAPYFSEALIIDAMAVVQTMTYGDDAQARALAGLAPYLSRAQIYKALAIVDSFQPDSGSNLEPRAAALMELASRLAVLGDGEKALDIALSIQSSWWRVDALINLAPHLTLELQRSLLHAAQQIERETGAEKFDLLLPHLRSELRDEVIALHGINWVLRYELSLLAPSLSHELLAAGLAAVMTDEQSWWQFESFKILAPYLPPNLLAEALVWARRCDNLWQRASALSSLASFAPYDLMPAVLQAVQTITDPIIRVEPLLALAARVPALGLREITSLLQSVEDENRWEIIARVLPVLSAAELREVATRELMALSAITDVDTRADRLESLAPYLPEALLPEGLAIVRQLPTMLSLYKDTNLRARTLAVFVPRLQPELLHEALAIMRVIGDEADCAEALAAYANKLPLERQQVVYEHAKALTQAILNTQLQTMTQLRITLAAPSRERISSQPATVSDKLESVSSSDEPPTRTPNTLQWIRALPPGVERARGFATLLTQSLGVERPTIIAEALVAARAIKELGQRARALVRLLPHLSTDERLAVLEEALSAVEQLPEWDEFIDDSPRAEAITWLTPYLPESLLPRAVAATCGLYGAFHAHASAALAPYLPPPQREAALLDAVRKVSAIEFTEERVEGLRSLAPQLANLPLERTYRIWCETLSAAASHRRRDLLQTLAALLPLCVTLGNDIAFEEICSAVQHATRWWP